MAINQNDYTPQSWQVGSYLTAKQMTELSTAVDKIEEYVQSKFEGFGEKEVIKPVIQSLAAEIAKNEADKVIAKIVGEAPATLDTLVEIANALGEDPNLATTLMNQITANHGELSVAQNDIVAIFAALADKAGKAEFEAHVAASEGHFDQLEQSVQQHIEQVAKDLQDQFETIQGDYIDTEELTQYVSNATATFVDQTTFQNELLKKASVDDVSELRNVVIGHTDALATKASADEVQALTGRVDGIDQTIVTINEQIDQRATTEYVGQIATTLTQKFEQGDRTLATRLDTVDNTLASHNTLIESNRNACATLSETIQTLETQVSSEFATKGEVDIERQRINTNNASIANINTELAKKADASTTQIAIDNLNEIKADKTAVNDSLVSVDKALSAKQAAIDAIDATLLTKADKVYVDQQLATKVSVEDYTTYNTTVANKIAEIEQSVVNHATESANKFVSVNEEIGKNAASINTLSTNFNSQFVAQQENINAVTNVLSGKLDKSEYEARVIVVDDRLQTLMNTKASDSDLQAAVSDIERLEETVKDYDIVGSATQFVEQKIADLVDSAPETLNTLNELAAAFVENADVIGTVQEVAGNNTAAIEQLRAVVESNNDTVTQAISNLTAKHNEDVGAVESRLDEVGTTVQQLSDRHDSELNDLKKAVLTGDEEVQAQLKAELNEVVGQIETVNKALETKADIEVVKSEREAALTALKTDLEGQITAAANTHLQDKSALEGLITTKADASEVNETLATKVAQITFDAYVGQQNDELLAIKNNVDTKANATHVSEKFAGIDATLVTKADQTFVVGELAKKADAEQVASDLGLKADQTFVVGELAKKADAEQVASDLGLKADQTFVVGELAKKVEQEAFNNLQGVVDAKADQAAVIEQVARLDAEIDELKTHHDEDLAVKIEQVTGEVTTVKANVTTVTNTVSKLQADLITEHKNHQGQYNALVADNELKAYKSEVEQALEGKADKTEVQACVSKVDFEAKITEISDDYIESDTATNNRIAAVEQALENKAAQTDVDAINSAIGNINTTLVAKANWVETKTHIENGDKKLEDKITALTEANTADHESYQTNLNTLNVNVSDLAEKTSLFAEQTVQALDEKANAAEVDTRATAIESDVAVLKALVDLDVPVSSAIQTAAEQAVNNVVDGAPDWMNTLKEVSDAMAKSDTVVEGIMSTIDDNYDKHEERLDLHDVRLTKIEADALNFATKEQASENKANINAIATTLNYKADKTDVNAVESRVTNTEWNIKDHASAISSLQTNHRVDIEAIRSDLNNYVLATTLEDRFLDETEVKNHVSEVAKLKADVVDVVALQEQVNAHVADSDARLDALEEADKSTFNKHEQDIADLKQQVADEGKARQADINVVNGQIVDVSALVNENTDKFNQRAADLEKSAGDHSIAISQLNDKMEAVEQHVSDAVGLIDSRITEYDKTAVASIDGKLAERDQKITANQEAIQGNSANIAAHTTRIGSLESGLDDTKRDVETLRNDVTGLETNFGSFSDMVQDRLDAVETAAEGIVVESIIDQKIAAAVEGHDSDVEASIKANNTDVIDPKFAEVNTKIIATVEQFDAFKLEAADKHQAIEEAAQAQIEAHAADVERLDGRIGQVELAKADKTEFNAHVVEFAQFKSMYEDVIAEMGAEIAELRGYIRELQSKVEDVEQIESAEPVVIESMFTSDMVTTTSSATKSVAGDLTIESGTLANQSADPVKETTYNFVSKTGDVAIGDMTISDSILNVTAGPTLDQINADQVQDETITVVEKVTAETMPSKDSVNSNGEWVSSSATTVAEQDIVVEGGTLTRQDEDETHETTYNFRSTTGTATISDVVVEDSILNVTAGPALGA